MLPRSPLGRDALWASVGFIVAAETTGAIGAAMSGVARKNAWIDDTAKPRGWPPFWVFPAAWTFVNYPVLGAATGLVWQRRRQTEVSPALRLFALQLLYTMVFLPIVYRLRRRSVYVAMDLLGAGLTVVTARSYARVDPTAGLLIVPYLGWMAFTTVIKALWWRMGRQERAHSSI
jgi:tryptophan-rich sensory protein